MPTFETWLAKLLGQRELEIRRLMNDGTAIRFLMVWSMFEGRYLRDSANEQVIDQLAKRIVDEGFNPTCLSEALNHLHARYQDKSRLRALLHDRKSKLFNQIISIPIAELSPIQQAFLVMFVVFRFRNNMFHGNKGVESWLKYSQQIQLCTEVMQAIILHAEANKENVAA